MLPKFVFCLGFIFLTCVDHQFANGHDIRFVNDSKCNRRFNTNEYKYNDNSKFSIGEIRNETGIYLNFFVQGERDAHIIFSLEDKPQVEKGNAYEIVLGSKSNEQSAIRLQRYSQEKKTSEEKNILSGKDWRQFWIQINSKGDILVGKGNEGAFMTLNNTSEYNIRIKSIRHYAFSSWDEAKIQWFIPCPKNISNAFDLKKDLFENYTTLNVLGTVNITFRSHSANVKDSSLKINATISITWEDDKLRWNTSEYYEINELKVEVSKVKKPNITMPGNFPKMMNSGDVNISPNGTVTWMAKPQSISLDSCLPKGNSLHIPVLKCSIEVTNSKGNITFITWNEPSQNGTSLYNLVHDETSSLNQAIIELKYNRWNYKPEDPNREQKPTESPKTVTKEPFTIDNSTTENPSTENSSTENPTPEKSESKK